MPCLTDVICNLQEYIMQGLLILAVAVAAAAIAAAAVYLYFSSRTKTLESEIRSKEKELLSREAEAHALQARLETEAQAKVLLSKKCFVAQGNFYEHPLPSEDFSAKYLQNGTINAQSTFGE